MAFDSTTRNKLAKMVASARSLLSKEFTEQLQEIYGIQPDGTIIETEKLSHLNDEELSIASMLRDRVEHLASNMTAEKKPVVSAIDRMIREQAFTLLNRFAALRMCEERNLIQESIGNGIQSKGFKVYLQIAGSGLGETYARYKTYLLCLFDEIAVDLGDIFDRFSSYGLLFPREDALLELLEIVNDKKLKHLWAEDETIGWIYQYFNSQEERKKMRDESIAPRNSRELAVRNQFFTPRYVVEFLTDNTLGRIWYEMTQGETSLIDQCRYLIRRPNEIFMAEGEEIPEDEQNTEKLSQEELLKQPVYIPFRKLKDPRDIRMLDPACGSMHFGLYAYDLYERIYEEAWDIEGHFGSLHFQRSEDLVTLHELYETKENFLTDVPRLIIEHNIHGIDIDSRAAQIAGLSLWLRAQRRPQRSKIKTSSRPKITKSNIVCAEQMPGDKKMLAEFTENLQPRVLGQLIEIIFDKMQLAGEAGSVLKIEEEIEGAIEKARVAFNEELQKRRDEAGFLPGMAPQKKQASIFDFADLPTKTQFWNNVESNILSALREYSKQADSTVANRKTLFAQDTEKGLAFIDLCSKQYDIVLMNPPFGKFSKLWAVQAKASYPNSANDILGAFVERFLHRLSANGLLGAITSRTCFFLTTFNDWRQNVVLKESAVRAIADLGQGVMDDAMVEAAAYVLEKTSPTSNMTVFRAIADADRQRALEACLDAHQTGKSESRLFISYQQTFDLLPDSPFIYWINDETIRQFNTGSIFEPDVGLVRVGLQTGDDPRYVRATWEVRFEDTIFCYYPSNGDPFCSFDDPIVQSYFKRREKGTPQWAFHVKSGASQPWYSPITLKVNWAFDGAELRNFKNDKGKLRSRPQNILFYYRPGFSWTLRAPRLYPYVVPSNCIPSVSRYMAFPLPGKESEAVVVCSSRIASSFLRFYAEKFEWPKFLVEWVKRLPWPEFPDEVKSHFQKLISHEVETRRLAYQNHEPFHEFLLPAKIKDFSNGGQSLAFDSKSLLDIETEKMVADAFGFNEKQVHDVERDLLEAISYQQDRGVKVEGDDKGDNKSKADGEDTDSDFVLDYSKAALEEANLSYLVGTTFGRWDIRYATGVCQRPKLADPFDPLPVCPLGMLQNDAGLPAESKDVPADYPLRISWSGIIVDDENHTEDIIVRVRESIEVVWPEHAESIEQETCEVLGVKNLRDYFRRPTSFFADHLKRYSKSRRQAPIYWPLSTKSGSYTLWIYYNRLTDQTLFSCATDFVTPKIHEIEKDIARLRSEVNEQVSISNRQILERLLDFEQEMKDFHDELLRIANLPYKPNLNDGVLINAAPLSTFFGHRKWNNDLINCWKKIEKGEYDWSHMAYNIWPERVIPKCHKDRSLAIAHDLENELWGEIEDGTDQQGNPKYTWSPKILSKDDIQRIIREKTGK